MPKFPTLPAPSWLLTVPGRLLPSSLQSRSLVLVLNRLLRDALDEGALDFLDGRTLQIQINDLALDYRVSLKQGKLISAASLGEPDVRFGGKSADFLLLALNKEDPDTLFFQRRLQLEGDTELGLEIKNFLYTLDENFLPRPIRMAGEKLLRILS